MCARTKISASLRDLRRQFAINLEHKYTSNDSGLYSPGDSIPFVIKGKDVDRVITSSMWGHPLNNDTNGYIYNARIENVTTKPFWVSYQNSRVLIPVNSFLERSSWYKSADHSVIALGALYMRDTYNRSVVICTTFSQQPDMAVTNPRMPVVVSEDDWDQWLDPSVDITTFIPITTGFVTE